MSFLVDKLNWQKAVKVIGEHQGRQYPAMAPCSTEKFRAFAPLRFRLKRKKKKKPGLGERTDQQIRKERLLKRKLGKKGVCRWNSVGQLLREALLHISCHHPD